MYVFLHSMGSCCHTTLSPESQVASGISPDFSSCQFLYMKNGLNQKVFKVPPPSCIPLFMTSISSKMATVLGEILYNIGYENQ